MLIDSNIHHTYRTRFVEEVKTVEALVWMKVLVKLILPIRDTVQSNRQTPEATRGDAGNGRLISVDTVGLLQDEHNIRK